MTFGKRARARRRCSARLVCPSEARTRCSACAPAWSHQKGLDLILGSDRLSIARRAVRVPRVRASRRYEAGLSDLAPPRPDRVGGRTSTSPTARAPADGRRRLVAHAVTVRALRAHADAGPALRRDSSRRAASAAWPTRIEDGETGLLFDEYTPSGLDGPFARAIDRYHDQPAWQTHASRGAMAPRLRVGRAPVARYLEVYRRALRRCGRTRRRLRRSGAARWILCSRFTAIFRTC